MFLFILLFGNTLFYVVASRLVMKESLRGFRVLTCPMFAQFTLLFLTSIAHFNSPHVQGNNLQIPCRLNIAFFFIILLYVSSVPNL